MKETKAKIRPIAFFIPLTAIIAVAVVSIITSMQGEDALVIAIENLNNAAMAKFGWLYNSCALACLVFVVWLGFSKYGKIRFGGADAKPQFSYWNWFAMTLCAGIAIGLVYWGVAEPVMQLAYPPESYGIAGFSPQAATFSLSQIFMEWTLTPYAIYSVCGILSAYTIYNLRKPTSIAATLTPLFGEKMEKGVWSQVIDAIILFSLMGGVCTSLGEGILQVAGGLEYVFGISPRLFVYGTIALVIVAMYTLSSYTGLKRGIRVLSDINTKIYFVFLVFLFVVGPTTFILNIGFESLAEYAETIFSRHLFLGAVTGDQYPYWWTIFFFAVWFAWAPVTGMFLAKLAYGRSIRDFVIVNMVAASGFGIIWFTVFGGSAIYMQLFDGFDISGIIDSMGSEVATYAFLQQLPLGGILIFIFLFMLVISFVTAADSMTSTASNISVSEDMDMSNGNQEAPGYIKLIWGISLGLVACLLVNFANITGVKAASTLAGMPAVLVVLLQMFSLGKVLKKHGKRELRLIAQEEEKAALAEEAAEAAMQTVGE